MTRVRRAAAVIQACALGLIFAIGVSTPAPAATQSGPAPEEKSVRLPAAYSDARSARFWKRVEDIVGARLGYSAETDQSSKSVTFEVGAVHLTGRDRKRLRRAVPEWAKLETFRTRYSIADLREFGARAERALSEEGLDELWSGFGYLGEPDLVTITLVRDDDHARDVLREELPRGAYEVEIGSFHGASREPASKGLPGARSWTWGLTLVAAAVGATGLVLARRSRRGSGETAPAA